MTGIRYIIVSVFLALAAIYIAVDFDDVDLSWLTFLSFENMCNDPEMREYVFKPFTCDKYTRAGVVDVTGGTIAGLEDMIIELDEGGEIVQIAD